MLKVMQTHQNANQNGLDIKKYTDIYEKGTDYTVENFRWEMTGWEWQCKELNKIVDNAKPGYSPKYKYIDSTGKEILILNSVVEVTSKINGTDSLLERQTKYNLVADIIK